MKNLVSEFGIPKDYGNLDKRNYLKIDIYVNGEYKASTTWAVDCKVARLAFAIKNRLPIHQVKAVRS